MLCERCKMREANIQYTEVVNGVRTEHNLCAQCAREMDFGPYSAIFDSEFPLGKLLSSLLGLDEEEQEERVHHIVCPTCGTSYEEFVKNSRFGCPDCYGVFDLLIGDNMKQLQGSDTHKGKRPRYRAGADGAQELVSESGPSSGDGKVSANMTAGAMAGAVPAAAAGSAEESGKSGVRDANEQIRVLKARLSEALAREEYEKAAQCRDWIRALEKELESGKEDEADEMV